LSAILGGALGNVTDRVIRGHVIDYLDFHHPALAGVFVGGHFPAFNVADVGITLGATLLVLDELQRWRQQKTA
jgi:signal peptidase II